MYIRLPGFFRCSSVFPWNLNALSLFPSVGWTIGGPSTTNVRKAVSAGSKCTGPAKEPPPASVVTLLPSRYQFSRSPVCVNAAATTFVPYEPLKLKRELLTSAPTRAIGLSITAPKDCSTARPVNWSMTISPPSAAEPNGRSFENTFVTPPSRRTVPAKSFVE